MTSRILLRIATALLLITPHLAGQGQQRRPQLTPKQLEASRALADMTRPSVESARVDLLADPKDVTIFLDDVLFDANRPQSLDEEITRASCASDLVVVGTIQDQASFLTEDASFILTDYSIRVVSTWRGQTVAPGSIISYVRSGGSVNIDGRVVSASHSMYPPLLRGQTYLLFTKRPGLTASFVKPATGYLNALVGDKSLRRLSAEFGDQSTAEVQPDHARAVVAAAKCQPGGHLTR